MLYFAVYEIGVRYQAYHRNDEWAKEERYRVGGHDNREYRKKSERAKNPASHLVCALPYGVRRESPRRTDTKKEIAFRPRQYAAEPKEEDTDSRHDDGTHIERRAEIYCEDCELDEGKYRR